MRSHAFLSSLVLLGCVAAGAASGVNGQGGLKLLAEHAGNGRRNSIATGRRWSVISITGGFAWRAAGQFPASREQPGRLVP
jgi:hypothetical protein